MRSGDQLSHTADLTLSQTTVFKVCALNHFVKHFFLECTRFFIKVQLFITYYIVLYSIYYKHSMWNIVNVVIMESI